MDLTFIIAVGFAAVLFLTDVVLLYLHFYKRHINKILQKDQAKQKKMMPPHRLLPWALALLVVIMVAAVVLDMEFDLSQSRLTTKEEILENARIGYEDTQSQIAMSADVAAVLSYSEDLSESEFRVYINKNSNRPNYIFRCGGDLTAIQRAAYLMEYKGTFILFSCNTCRISEIRCENGTTYRVDPDLPFVLVIPDGGSLLSYGAGESAYHGYTGISVLDEKGNTIDLTQLQWFEMRKID